MFVGDQNIYLSTFIDPAEGFDLTTWQWVTGIRQQLPYIGTGKDSKYKTIQDVINADKAGERVRMVVTLHPHRDPQWTKASGEGFASQLGKLDRRFGVAGR